MLTLQREACAGVFELAHPIQSIVAGQAVLPIIPAMLDHKRLILFPMAIRTTSQVRLKAILLIMACNTLHWGIRVIELVPIQAKRGLGMVKLRQCVLYHVEIPPAMIRMASGAMPHLGYRGMGSASVLDLSANILMTTQAQLILSSFKRLMTTAALLLKTGVRLELTGCSNSTALCTEWTRAERFSTADNRPHS
jgi:hypothetical protein